MAGHDIVFFLNAFISVESVKIRGLIIWLRLRCIVKAEAIQKAVKKTHLVFPSIFNLKKSPNLGDNLSSKTMSYLL